MQVPSSICSYGALAALTRRLSAVLSANDNVRLTRDGSLRLSGEDGRMTPNGGISSLVMEEALGSLVA
jgi:hypothetical protein